MSNRDDDGDSPTETATGTHLPDDPIAMAVKEGPMPLVTVPVEHYEIGPEHARGGLGKIVVAEDRRLGRTVAIKELIHVGESAQRRLIREARLTAKLQHPAIVPVHEAGRWPTGEPFYTMKMVSGRSLKDAIHERKTLKERLGLLPNMIAVAEAMAYAHSRKVIHRDLKPSNVLVGEFGETVVIDWGLAKDLSDDSDELPDVSAGPYRVSDKEGLTAIGAVLGTPAYMPPEQARGEVVDERADVYSLGGMLYHLLTGTPPFSGSSEEVLDSVKIASPAKLQEVVPSTPPELAAIVQRAMEREPGSRYAHAGALAEDLTRFQAGQLVNVHDYSIADLAVRWIRKNLPLAIATLVFLVFALTGLAIFIRRERGLRTIAEQSLRASTRDREQAEREHDRAESKARSLMEDRGRDELEKGYPTRAAVYFSALLRQSPANRAYRSWLTQTLRAMRAVKWRVGLNSGASRALYQSHDRKLLMVLAQDVVVLDASTGSTVSHIAASTPSCAAFSADDQLVITSTPDGTMQSWDSRSGELKQTFRGIETARACTFAPTGHRVAVISAKSSPVIFDADTGALVRSIGRSREAWGAYPTVQWSTDGRLLIAGSGNALDVYDVGTGRLLWSTSTSSPTTLINMPFQQNAARNTVISVNRGVIYVHDLRTGAVLERYPADVPIVSLSVSEDGNSILAVSDDGQIIPWTNGIRSAGLPGFRGHSYVRAVFLSAQDDVVVALSVDNQLRFVGPEGHLLTAIDIPGDGRAWISARYDAPLVYVATVDGSVYAIRTPLGDVVREAGTVSTHVTRIAYANGSAALAIIHDGQFSLFDKGAKTWSFKADDFSLWRFAISPDGSRIFTSPEPPATTSKLWDSPSGKLVAILQPQTAWICSVAYSPDSSVVATADRKGTVRFWDGHTGKPLGEPLYHAGSAITFSPDGRVFATGGGKITVRQYPSRQVVLEIDGHQTQTIDALVYDPAGSILVSAGWDDHVAKVWDAHTGRLIATLSGHTDRLFGLDVSRDGRTVATSSADFTARLWDAQTGALLRVIDGPTRAIAFSRDGTELATGVGSSVMIWDITEDALSPTDLAAEVERTSRWRLDDGRLVLAR